MPISTLTGSEKGAVVRAKINEIISDVNAGTPVTLAGTPNYITIVGQVITRALINLASHVTGTLPVANGGTGVTTSTGSGANVLGTSPNITTPAIASIKGTITADTDGATITFDKNVSDFHSVTMAGNRTLALTNMATGDRIVLRLQQDGTGSRVPTFFTTIKWAGGSTPTLTTTPSKADVFGFLCTSAGNYDGFIIGQNI